LNFGWLRDFLKQRLWQHLLTMPIAESIEEYQQFLNKLGYSPLAEGAFGK
jgi:hypothetical protein